MDKTIIQVRIILGATLVLLVSLSFATFADSKTSPEIKPYLPPAQPLELMINDEGWAYLELPQLAKPEDTMLSFGQFQNQKGEGAILEFENRENSYKPGTKNPIKLFLKDYDKAANVWGKFYLTNNEKSYTYDLVLGKVSPRINNLSDEGVVVAKSGSTISLEVDLSQHLNFGNSVSFKLVYLEGEEEIEIPLFQPSNKTQSQFIFNHGHPRVWLSLDTSLLENDIVYRAYLYSQIGKNAFAPRPFFIKVTGWDKNTVLRKISPIVTERRQVKLGLSSEDGKAVYGLSVESLGEGNENVDPRNDFDVQLNGQSLWSLDVNDPNEFAAKSLQTAEKNEIVVSSNKTLPVGKHTLKLGISGLNTSKAVEAQITFIVKKHAVWAFLALTSGVILSFFMTKGIRLANKRNALRKKIQSLKSRSWLKEDRWGALPIVKAFVRLEMADKALNFKYRKNPFKQYFYRLLTSPEAIKQEVEEVEQRLDAYQKLNKVAITWGVAPSKTGSLKGMDYRIVWRADKEIRYLVDQLSELQAHEPIPDKLLGKLDRLASWTDMDSLIVEYKSSQKRDIDRLVIQVDENWFKDSEATKLVKKLVEQLRKVEIKSLDDALKIENSYIKLKLIWEQRFWLDRVKDLVKKINADQQLELILNEFDEEVWAILSEEKTLKLVSPVVNNLPVEQYSLVEFKVDCVRTEANTFLFKHGLQYEWNIQYQDDRKPLTPITRCPMVSQFIPQIPENQEVRVSVVVRWKDNTIELIDERSVTFFTRSTTRFNELWPINTPEVMSIGIALILAMIAGLQSDAFSNALIGSWNELLVLVAWGIAADQTKNLIQNINELSSST